MDTVIRHLRRAVLRQDARTDGQLLASFIDKKDESAFEALVHRHGPMVFGVCRRVAGNYHDAEDAFQATFLVLARKAPSVRPRERVANWLHGVALRTAMKAKTMTGKRRVREKQVTEMPEPEAAQQDQWRDLQPLLDQELNGLPEYYRLPILLCDLEGKTIKEATGQLGWPQGTLATRLARGRKLLAKRLTNRGIVLSAGSLAAVVSQKVASAGVPASLVASTMKAVTVFAAGQAAASGAISPTVAALMEGVLKTMLINRLKVLTAVLLAVGVLTISTGMLHVPTAVGTAAGREKDRETHQADSGKPDESRDIQVRIAGPRGMKVSVLTAAGPGKAASIEVPERINLRQGKLFRLKLADIPNRPGVERFPTIEIPRADATTELFVTSSAIPIQFTDEDFDQVNDGNMIVKVVYLNTATKGSEPGGRQGEPDTIVSYRLEPGSDAIVEARRRGAILAVVRMGNIDLEMAEAKSDKGRAALPADITAAKSGKVEIGEDGVQGRVLRRDKENVKAKPIETSARKLVLAYIENDAKGDEQFLGKKLAVSGRVLRVERVAKGKAPHYLLTLYADPSEDRLPGEIFLPDKMPLAFVFPADSRKQLARLEGGQRVTIEGVCEGRTAEGRDNIAFRGCRIVKTVHLDGTGESNR
jgi:RNA polymerase sigma factor (sigma-70 family)